jgi:hypothetical protein
MSQPDPDTRRVVLRRLRRIGVAFVVLVIAVVA